MIDVGALARGYYDRLNREETAPMPDVNELPRGYVEGHLGRGPLAPKGTDAPVDFSTAEPIEIFRVPAGRPPTRFHHLIRDIVETHDRKSRDYASSIDHLANLRTSEALGIPAFMGTLVRMSDKWERIRNLARRELETGEGAAVVDETIVDTLRDLAVYSLLAIELYEEGKF